MAKVRIAPEAMTKPGADRHAKLIESYWLDCGSPNVVCRVEEHPSSMQGKGPIFVVRSNLVNGNPPAKSSA